MPRAEPGAPTGTVDSQGGQVFSTMVAVAVALVHTPLVWMFVGGVAAGALADKVSVRRGEVRRERANLEEVQRRRRAEWEARRRAGLAEDFAGVAEPIGAQPRQVAA